MNQIQILDCTLRDGGYCNKWRFGYNNARKIVNGIAEAGVELVECGFVSNKVSYDREITRFDIVERVTDIIPKDAKKAKFLAMINYGEYLADDIPCNSPETIDGIRVAFHKKDKDAAMDLCQAIKNKGYMVFVQAMVTVTYSDEELLDMIRHVNEIKPYAFYIVDSFGMMKEKELLRLFYLIDHNLAKEIKIGFHSHNNLQLAYSNAQKLVGIQTKRGIIIDVSIYGMGRGAGNLNSELFLDFMNENLEKRYNINPIIGIIDEILNEFYQQNYWGYSLPNYISAVHNAHPNYARYLDDKKTLTIEDMDTIFSYMDSRKVSFNPEYAEQLYMQFMLSRNSHGKNILELRDALEGKKVMLVAPGKNSVKYADKIKEYLNENVITISINHLPNKLDPDYIFVSNLRRFKELPKDKLEICIATSNIQEEGMQYSVKYQDLICNEDAVKDNAGLMAIKLMTHFNVSKVMLAGFDGYSHDINENYGSKELAFTSRKEVLDKMNRGIAKVLKEYSRVVPIEFITESKYLF